MPTPVSSRRAEERSRARRRAPRRPPPEQVQHARRAVARLLADRGPVPGWAAAAALGWSLDHWWATVAGCCWFEVTGKGWVLSADGQAAARPVAAPPD